MKILVTAGPTREYLDDVRYISNASSGRMGYAIVTAAIQAGHEVILVTGPVDLTPPVGCEIFHVETTDQMLEACEKVFPECDGLIAAAAVCDYKPKERVTGKIAKTGDPISLEMIETDDVLATLAEEKEHRWVIGFALEAQNARENALQKLRRKNCNFIVLNHPTAIGSETNDVHLLGSKGETVAHWSGTKSSIAGDLVGWLNNGI